MSFVDFVVLPPGHGRSVTDFWGWDAHEAQLRCPDGVWVVIEGDVVPGGALNLNSTNLPRPWSPRESSPSRKTPTVEPGIEPWTSWLVVRDSDHKTTRLVSPFNIQPLDFCHFHRLSSVIQHERTCSSFSSKQKTYVENSSGDVTCLLFLVYVLVSECL